MEYVWVGVGGFLGANARYALGAWTVGRWGAGFPIHTMLINVSGSFLIGVLLVLLTERLVVDPAWRLLLVVGFLGGYTTFSSYTFEALALAEAGQWLAAAWYVLGNNGLGLAAAYIGMVLTRVLSRRTGGRTWRSLDKVSGSGSISARATITITKRSGARSLSFCDVRAQPVRPFCAASLATERTAVSTPPQSSTCPPICRWCWSGSTPRSVLPPCCPA